MERKFIILINKKNGSHKVFRGVKELYSKIPQEQLGICINALYNALSKQDGVWENREFKIIKKVAKQRVTWCFNK